MLAAGIVTLANAALQNVAATGAINVVAGWVRAHADPALFGTSGVSGNNSKGVTHRQHGRVRQRRDRQRRRHDLNLWRQSLP